MGGIVGRVGGRINRGARGRAGVEDQTAVRLRHAAMQAIARFGWHTWVSYEPSIGAVDWLPWMRWLSWAAAGGEASSGARPTHPSWMH